MNKKTIILVVSLIVAVAILGTVSYFLMPKPQEGGKTITVEVNINDEIESFTYSTDAEFLGEVLIAEKLVEGSDSEFGLYVTTVNEYTADDSKQEWWSFSEDGTDLSTGIDSHPITDGKNYEITLKTGW